MPFMPASKISLLIGFLSVMPIGHAAPFDPGAAIRFGDWTLARPAQAATPSVLTGQVYKLVPEKNKAEELFLYYKDGEERALLLRFEAEGKDDRAVLRTDWLSERLNGCRYGVPARLPPLLTVLGLKKMPAGDLPELPDDSLLRIGNEGDRGLRRVGEELVADLGRFRVRLIADSPTVHVGEPSSGDFCRFESKAASEPEFAP